MKHVLLSLLVAIATPAAAQERMTRADCDGSWNAVSALVTQDAGEVSVTDAGWCRLTDAILPIDAGTSVRIDAVEWRASDIARLINDGLPPRAIEVKGEGLRVAPQTGDPVYDYLLGLQSSASPMSFGLSARWDGVQNAVLLEEAWLQLHGENRIELSARVEGVNLTDRAAIQSSAGSAGLRDLTLKTTFDGWFETHVAVALGSVLLTDQGTPPEVQVAQLQQQALAAIGALPDGFMPARSREALSDFAKALPAPRGHLQVQLSADPTLGASRFAPLWLAPDMPDLPTFIETVLAGVTVLVTWAPVEDRP